MGMINGYYYNYGTPMMNYVNYALVTAIAAVVAALVGVILFFTFFSKKNEDRFTGFKGRLYNLMTFNRFYAEDVLKFLYIVLTCVITVTGIVSIIMGSFIFGIVLLVAVNVAVRLAFELTMMFIMLCRKTVSMDRKLGRIANYYDDGYEAYGGGSPESEEWAEDPFEGEGEDDACGGDCGSCGVEGCGTMDEGEIDSLIDNIRDGQE